MFEHQPVQSKISATVRIESECLFAIVECLVEPSQPLQDIGSTGPQLGIRRRELNGPRPGNDRVVQLAGQIQKPATQAVCAQVVFVKRLRPREVTFRSVVSLHADQQRRAITPGVSIQRRSIDVFIEVSQGIGQLPLSLPQQTAFFPGRRPVATPCPPCPHPVRTQDPSSRDRRTSPRPTPAAAHSSSSFALMAASNCTESERAAKIQAAMMAVRMAARKGVAAEREPTPRMSACGMHAYTCEKGVAAEREPTPRMSACGMHAYTWRSHVAVRWRLGGGYMAVTWRACWMRDPPLLPSGPPMTSTAAFPFVFCSASSGMYAISLQGSKREYLAACDGM